MKKFSILTLLTISSLVLQACNDTVAPTNDTETSDYQTEEISEKYILAQTGGEASCARYKLYDENNKLIEVPEDLAEVFECPSVAELSPNTFKIAYENSNHELKIYDIPSKSEQKIADIDPNSSGTTCKWSPDGNKIACVLVNQEEYINMTNILLFPGINNMLGDSITPITYEEGMAFTCGSICTPDVFEFDGNDKLKFEKRAENGDTTPASLDVSFW